MLPPIYDTVDLWSSSRSPEAAPDLARLLQEETPPDDRNDIGETALHVAAAHGNDEAVELLLRHGADLLAADWESGWTPLHRSLYHRHLSTSLLLLRHAQTRFGKTFMRKYLHESRDFDAQSPMQLLSTIRPPDFRGACEGTNKRADGGLVYTFGKRDYQLGYHLPNADMQVSPRLVELPYKSLIVQLSASKYHTIALNAIGECFVWGFGKGGRLGTGSEFDRIEPTRLNSLESTPIQKVAAGENHTLALSRTGQVFSWGSNGFGQLGHPGKSNSSLSRLTPKRVDAFRFQVIGNIAASGCHSAAIDANDGVVYTWGSNRRGQLGRKEGCGTDQAEATPRTVDALCPRHPLCVVYGDYDSVRATQVAVSDWHTCVVLRCTQNGRSLGQVWQFGYGSYRPSRVNFPSGTFSTGVGAVMSDTWVPTCKQRGVDIVQVSCAQNHSIALTSSGFVFTWGHNAPALSHKSSGIFREQNAVASNNNASQSPSAPQHVPLINYGPVASVCASQDHCAVVTQRGDLVTWGCGQQGVLGHGRGNTWQPSPKRVVGVKKAVAVAAGHHHTAVLVSPVSPDFESEGKAPPTLLELVEREISAHVDVTNCAVVWQYAERYAATRLQNFCVKYMQNNWDAVLEGVGRERIDTLFEIMLPPVEEPEPEDKPRAVAPVEVEKVSKERKHWKQRTTSFSKKEVGLTGASDVKHLEKQDVSTGVGVDEVNFVEPPGTSTKLNGRRKTKSSKFVSLETFLSNTSSGAPLRDSSSPWRVPSVTTPTDKKLPVSPGCFPVPIASQSPQESISLPVASTLRNVKPYDNVQRQRKTSIGSHPSSSPRLSFSPKPTTGKHMLGYDGVEHEQVTVFSLDAFIKRPSRKGARSKSDKISAATWNNISPTGLEEKISPKTLKEIQEEEEAAANREREAKARLGGDMRLQRHSHSTVNSWGLFRAPDHVSLAEVQKLQEEQEFVEQQRQILAEIEREQAEKAAKKPSADRNKRLKARNSKETSTMRSGMNLNSTSSNAHASTDGHAGSDSQMKQKKQKKAKERKAARKAAGERFAGPSAPRPARASDKKPSRDQSAENPGLESAAVENKSTSKPKRRRPSKSSFTQRHQS